MLFNSFDFIFFFPFVVLFYFILPHKVRWAFLLAASYYFYMCWEPFYAILIFISTAISFWAALKMQAALNEKRKLFFLILSLVVSLGILFVFKYFNFSMSALAVMLNIFGFDFTVPSLKILLPVGISFYTFQTLSYSIDVYRGHKSVERHFGIFALYVSFFPQLVAGPIERSTNLLPQFHLKNKFDYFRVTNGLKLMLWGFFKKIVISDRLAIYVSEVYANPENYYGLAIVLATYFFAFQIYCDFSAYSDIAIGSSQVMGYTLMSNFNRPYFSKSVSEFWKRWHISLSTWFRDYLYIPLGGNRCDKKRWLTNLMIVFLVSGLWHGAGWTFVIWGALHGSYLVVEILTTSFRRHCIDKTGIANNHSLLRLIKVIITFHLVCFAWIFFRANTLTDAIFMLKQIVLNFIPSLQIMEIIRSVTHVALGAHGLIIAFGLIGLMEIIHLIQRKGSIRQMISEKPLIVRWLVYYAAIFGIIFLGVIDSPFEFIYFQF